MGKLRRVLKGKKKGSSILMVLMVATVLIMLSAVVSSALVFTTKGNEIAKVKSDYLYAAEGGIEYGIEEFTKSGAFTGFIENGVDKGVLVSFLSNSSVQNDKDIFEVRVACKENGTSNGYDLISTVYNRNNNVLAKVVVPITGRIGISKILEYTVASASGVKFGATGTIDFRSGKAAYNGEKPGDKWEQTAEGSNMPPTVENVKMLKPKFKTSLVDISSSERTYSNFSDLVIEAKRYPNIKENDENDELLNGIGYCHVGGYDVVFVSASKLNFTSATGLNKTIIVTDGEVNINSNNAVLTSSTIYAPTVNITGNNFHLVNAPLYSYKEEYLEERRVVPNNDLYNGFIEINYNITRTGLEGIDELLVKYMASYGASSNISGRPVINYEDAIYEY